ncbi:MAG: glycosyltransferase, partial [Planctomycetes bacterium]|nr:glycosyltransferase [Planctomycetota bacterium]
RTAMRRHRRTGVPLVTSTHTDVPQYARVVTRKAIRRLFGRNLAGRWLIDRWQVHERIERMLRRRLEHYLVGCDFVLASSDADFRRARRLLSHERVRRLRRGIDKDFFHPRHRDRPMAAQRFGIPDDRPWLLCVGRLDEAKRPLVLAKAAQTLLATGRSLHVVFVGSGPLEAALARELGPAASFTGSLSQEDLRGVYAAADLFVFPSTTEIMPNVVIEAKASGLPVLLSRQGGSGQMIRTPGEDGLYIDDSDPAAWAAAVERLLDDTSVRRNMAAAARRHIETGWPSWDDVLREDLLPVWKEAVRGSLTALAPTASA